MTTELLVLKPVGDNQDDYHVLKDGVFVARIFLSPVAPEDRHWMWASGHNGEIRRAAHGYEPTREAAMTAYAGGSWAGEGLTGGRYRRRRRR